MNILSLNVEKTKVMNFHKRKKEKSININGIEILGTNRFNFIGIVFINSSLHGKTYISTLVEKVSKIVHVMGRFQYIYPKSILN